MKQFISTLIISVVVVYALYIWNEVAQRRALRNAKYEQEIVQMKDSIHYYNVVDSTLRVFIMSQNSALLIARDSIKMYQNKLIITKSNYETLIANMFHWSNSEHIRFFSTETDTIR